MPRTKIDNIFTPYVTSLAIKLMMQLAERPCAKPFIDFFPELEIMNYKNIEPISISMIIQRLQTNDYLKISEWQHDMKQIPLNCVYLFGTKDPTTLLANQLYSVFEKKFELFASYSKAKWSKLVGLLTHQIAFKMLQKPPESIQMTSTINSTLIQNYPFIQFPFEEKVEIPQTTSDPSKFNENSNFKRIDNSGFIHTESANLIRKIDFSEKENSNALTFTPKKEITECTIKHFVNKETLSSLTSSKSQNKIEEISSDFIETKQENKTEFFESKTTEIINENNTEDKIESTNEEEETNSEQDIMNESRFEADNEDNEIDEDESSEVEPVKKRINLERSDRVLSNFLRAFSMLNTKEDVIEISKIIRESQPNIILDGESPVLDFDQLSQETIKKLMKYTKEKLEKL